jgi:hypothetical protein
MSFQAYLDNIKAKTGKGPEDFRILAEERGLLKKGVKSGEIVQWLKEDFGLGHGHAMAIVRVLKQADSPKLSVDEKISSHFGRGKARWYPVYADLMSKVGKFGDNVHVGPTNSYLSLLKGDRKFGVIQVTADRMDIGIKLEGVESAGRLEAAGSWNEMVTHRVRITEPSQIDEEVIAWLDQAYCSG